MIKIEHCKAGLAVVDVLHDAHDALELVASAVNGDTKASELPPHCEMLQEALGELTAAIIGFEKGFSPPVEVRPFCTRTEPAEPWRPYMIVNNPNEPAND